VITVNTREVEWDEGMTVTDVLKKMNYTSHLILVKVDGTVVPQREWDDTAVPDGANVEAIHLIGGG
jgi:thiamine biosynthesis protein ThiS